MVLAASSLEVDAHWHFVTIRCAGSLPKSALSKVQEIHRSLEAIEPNDPAFSQLQRQYLLTIEKYLDQPGTTGFAPFLEESCCQVCLKAFASMETEGWIVGEAVIMPNHLHCLIHRKNSLLSLKEVIMRFKGRSTRWLNQELGAHQKFWQSDWFDRWMRNEAELEKTVRYIRKNPVKARLVNNPDDYKWAIRSDWFKE